jgi:uncharacterized protein HemY
VRLAESARDAEPDNPEVLDTLAAAYAEEGQFTRASASAERALELAKAQANHPLIAAVRARQALYAKQRPFHGERTPAGAGQAKDKGQAPRKNP